MDLFRQEQFKSAVKYFSPVEASACFRLVASALEEDLSSGGDLTSNTVLAEEVTGKGLLVARQAGVIAGLSTAELVFTSFAPKSFFSFLRDDGSRAAPGELLARIEGRMRVLLAAERTALNFLQRLSGIATLTRRYVDAVAGLSVQILDTRKTTPGWRLLEKYAVRCGGGHNHRMGLYDGFLIKDNHLAALGGGPAAIRHAIQMARQSNPSKLPIEVEVDTLEQLNVALAERPDIVLLDNMSVDQLQEAVRRRNHIAPDVKLEASGGVTLQTVRGIAETGVDCISVGALTHSAPALDISMDFLQE